MLEEMIERLKKAEAALLGHDTDKAALSAAAQGNFYPTL